MSTRRPPTQIICSTAGAAGGVRGALSSTHRCTTTQRFAHLVCARVLRFLARRTCAPTPAHECALHTTRRSTAHHSQAQLLGSTDAACRIRVDISLTCKLSSIYSTVGILFYGDHENNAFTTVQYMYCARVLYFYRCENLLLHCPFSRHSTVRVLYIV